MALPYRGFVLGALLAQHAWELVLEVRQRAALTRGAPPPALAHLFDAEGFAAARAYALDRWAFAQLVSALNLVEAVATVVCDALPALWAAAGAAVAWCGLDPAESVLARSVAFALLHTYAETMLKLPLSAYKAFVVEEKHGFNKLTAKLFVTDTLKGMALTAVFVPPVLAAVLAIVRVGGRLLPVSLGAFVCAFSLLMTWLYPTLIMPLFNKFMPLEDSPLKAKIEALASRLEFPLTKLFVMDGSTRSGHSNAFLFGFFKNKRIVLFDTLLEHCKGSDGEVVAILAHELGHWHHSHTWKNFVVGQVLVVAQFAAMTLILDNQEVFGAFGFGGGETPVIAAFYLFGFFTTPLDAALTYAMHVLSRTFEFQADAFSASLGYGEHLRAGLLRLQKENKGNPNVDPWYSAYHYSHPPLVERLEAIAAETEKAKAKAD